MVSWGVGIVMGGGLGCGGVAIGIGGGLGCVGRE